MPSQSPMNGSTKYRTSASATTVGGNHHRHARQNEAVPVGALDCTNGNVSDVFVVRGIWVNELSFDRSIRPFNHLYAITLRIVLNFVHDVVDEQDPSTGSSEQVCRIARIRNLTNIETLTLVFDSECRFLGQQFSSDLQKLRRIVFVSVLDRVHERFVESDKEIRSLGFDQSKLRDPFLKIFENTVHQSKVAWKFKLDLLVNVRKEGWVVDVFEFVREGLLDDLAEFVAVVRQPEIIGRSHFESSNVVLGKLADDQIETVEVGSTECFRALGGHHDLVTEASERFFENTQLIVIIDDENPPFIHTLQSCQTALRRDFDRLYE